MGLDKESSRHELMESGITADGYEVPPWVSNDGRYFDAEGKFDPNAFDPAAPYKTQGEVYTLKSNQGRELESAFDLNNLRFIDPKRVDNLLVKLEGAAAEIDDSGNGKEVVAMIGTGGTIAMTMKEGELVPTLDPPFLLAHTGGGLENQFSVSSTEFPTPIDSSQQEIDYEADLVIAMSWLWNNMSDQLKKVFSGFLITHGTDTMGGGSTAVTMMLGPNAPFSVGFVGAQTTIEHQYSDVAANVKGSFQTLKSLRKKNKVARFVYMGGTDGGAFHPAGVMKTDDRSVNAFTSPMHDKLTNAGDFGIHGIVNRFGQRYMETLERGAGNPKFQPTILRGYTPIIDLNPKIGIDPRQYYEQIMKNEHAVAVLLTTFGSYTANAKIREAIGLAAERTGKIVLGANPFPGGSTDHSYGPAKALRDSGAYPVGTLPDATAIKVFLGSVAFGGDRKKLAEFLTRTNIVGEQPPNEWMLKNDDGETTRIEDKSNADMPRFGLPNAFYDVYMLRMQPGYTKSKVLNDK